MLRTVPSTEEVLQLLAVSAVISLSFYTYQIEDNGGDERLKKMNFPYPKILNHRLLFFSILSILFGHITAATSIFLSEFLSFKFVLLEKIWVLLMDFLFPGRGSCLFPKRVKA